MDESLELLEYIHESADMGVKSTTKLLHLLEAKDNKIKQLLENELKKYENFYKDSKKLLEKHKITPKSKGIMASIMANTSMQMEIMKDNSDSKIADLLTRGFTMGILEIEKRIHNFKGEVNKEIMKMANMLLDFQKKEIEDLKQYI